MAAAAGYSCNIDLYTNSNKLVTVPPDDFPPPTSPDVRLAILNEGSGASHYVALVADFHGTQGPTSSSRPLPRVVVQPHPQSKTVGGTDDQWRQAQVLDMQISNEYKFVSALV